MGTTGTLYDDPGADYFTKLHPERTKNRAIHQLEAMGYQGDAGHRVLTRKAPDATTGESSRQSAIRNEHRGDGGHIERLAGSRPPFQRPQVGLRGL